MDIKIPRYVNTVLRTLRAAGCESFVVGGCVRDALMGKAPSDWDVCTSAKPEEIKGIFSDQKTIDMGIRHGTVAVLTKGGPVEVTTYRIDGEYLDGRHPEKVEFTESLEEDLARRDFTMNAIAYHPQRGLVDPFYGREAITMRRIVCVGAPEKRFEEDALRILRGLRFASVQGFQIDRDSAAAMKTCAGLIRNVSVERINVELSKLITGAFADRVLEEFTEIIKIAVPDIIPTPIQQVPAILPVRLALLFPQDTETVLRKLKYDNRTIKSASALARLFQEPEPRESIETKKLLSREGEEIARLYFESLGRSEELENLFKSKACYSIRQLAVNGRDLISAGVEPGQEIGRTLNRLLDLVIEGKIENDRETLLRELR